MKDFGLNLILTALDAVSILIVSTLQTLTSRAIYTVAVLSLIFDFVPMLGIITLTALGAATSLSLAVYVLTRYKRGREAGLKSALSVLQNLNTPSDDGE